MTEQEKTVLTNKEFKLWIELEEQKILCAKKAWLNNNQEKVSYEVFSNECDKSLSYCMALSKWSVVNDLLEEFDVKKITVLRIHYLNNYYDKRNEYVIR